MGGLLVKKKEKKKRRKRSDFQREKRKSRGSGTLLFPNTFLKEATAKEATSSSVLLSNSTAG